MNFIGTGLIKIATTSILKGFPGGSAGKNLPAVQETLFHFLDLEDPLEKALATHFSILGVP